MAFVVFKPIGWDVLLCRLDGFGCRKTITSHLGEICIEQIISIIMRRRYVSMYCSGTVYD